MVPADSREDVASHGCSSGIVGQLIYTSDCVRYYRRHEQAIWDIAMQLGDDIGESIIAKIATDSEGYLPSFQNNMAWFAVEEICRMLTEEYD